MSRLAQRVQASRLYPVLYLEQLISHHARRVLIWFGQLLLLALIGLTVWAWRSSGVLNLRRWLGAVLVCLTLTIIVYLVEVFFRSYYYHSLLDNNYQPTDLFTFTVGRILYQATDEDVWRAFLRSDTGRSVLARLGVTAPQITAWLKQRQPSPATLELGGETPLTLARLVDWLYSNDEAFQKWLFHQNIKGPELEAATRWVVRMIESRAQAERWWSRERLERVPGLAKTWAYGETPTLGRYSEDLLAAAQASGFVQTVGNRKAEARALETILLRSREANALIVGEPGEGKMDLVWQLVNEIKRGTVTPALEQRRPILFHTALFLAAFREREPLEQELIKLFNEAERAGNLILIIDDLAALVLGSERLGADISGLLNPYLVSPNLPVIALVDNDTFHRELERRGELLRRFEKLAVTEIDQTRLITLLEDAALRLESVYQLTFTYQALVATADSAERYFQLEATTDRALDLLTELAPWARDRGSTLVNRDEVLAFVQGKTGIPLGPISAPERDRLLHLEEELKKQVIGQTGALEAIAQALRRSRAGTRNEARPIGSFLFLGPTGVGKTETAKALARVLFGREEALLRLDMSEYQAPEALNRLIGSFSDGQPGILANLLRQNPYGVLLLDEFEKTNQAVLNLFLQILDEGFFSDMLGRRVNARNILFIATSNAAAEMIWRMVEAGEDPASARGELVQAIIRQGAFRPELLNRFDELIIFHPLKPAELAQVAKLQLERLAQRLRERGLDFTPSAELIAEVVAKGSDPTFGARPMARYIETQVEQAVADKLVAGSLRPGATISFIGGRLVTSDAS